MDIQEFKEHGEPTIWKRQMELSLFEIRQYGVPVEVYQKRFIYEFIESLPFEDLKNFLNFKEETSERKGKIYLTCNLEL